MTYVEIYHKGAKLVSEPVKYSFLIAKNDPSGDISWERDDQSNPGEGTVNAWIQSASFNPRILGVLPEWQLIIDGEKMEPKFYNEIENLKGKIVELQHGDYRFVFHFEPLP